MAMLNRAETAIENITFQDIDENSSPFIELSPSDIRRCGQCALCDKPTMSCRYPSYLRKKRGEITEEDAMELLFDMRMPTNKQATQLECTGGFVQATIVRVDPRRRYGQR